jgi:hypothetical protein
MMYEGRVGGGEYEYIHRSGVGKSQNTVYKLDATTQNRAYALTYVLLYIIFSYLSEASPYPAAMYTRRYPNGIPRRSRPVQRSKYVWCNAKPESTEMRIAVQRNRIMMWRWEQGDLGFIEFAKCFVELAKLIVEFL